MLQTIKTPLQAVISQKGVTALARELGISTSTVYAWIEQNRIPARRIIAFANAVDLELPEVMEFASHRDIPAEQKETLIKPQGTLDCLLAIKRGEMTVTEAAEVLKVSEHALKVTYEKNQHRLEALHETLSAFSRSAISIQAACEALGVTRTQVYYLMRTYGVARPEREKAAKSPGRYTQTKPVYEKEALDVIAGRTNAKKAAETHGIALRTLHRYIEKFIAPRSLTEISHWPASFRLAFAMERQEKCPKWVEKWVDFALQHGLVLEKKVRAPKPVVNWREVDAKRMLIATLQGEASLSEIAQLRGGSETALKGLFDGVLRPLGLGFREVASLPVLHQMALADLLILIGSHYRRAV